MSNKKEKRVNVRPYHAEIVPERNGDFVLKLFSRNLVSGVRTEYCIHFEHWWLPYIAKMLWEVIACRRKALDASENALRGAP